MTTRLRLGVIGAGAAFRHLHLPNIARHSEAIEVVSVTASSLASASNAADVIAETTGTRPTPHENAQSLLASKPDLVLLNVPIAATYQLALEALRAGAHLVCEKPLGEDARQAADIVQAAETAGLFLGVCENFRYQPRFAQVADLVAEGTIGTPRAYFLNDLHYVGPDGLYSDTAWRQRGDHRGGYLLDGGSHIVAGLRAMVGETPATAHALPTSFHPGHLGAPWDTALANLRFGSGLIGHLALGYGSPDKEARHPKILGTSGTIVLKETAIEVWRPDASDDLVIDITDSSDGIAHEWDDFVAVLRGRESLAFSPWEAVADLAVLDAVLESAQSGEVTDVRNYGM